MELYQILLIVIGCLLFVSFVLIFFISIFVTRKIVYPHRYTKEEQDSYNKKMGYDKGFETLEKNKIVFKMSDGYELNGDYNIVPGSNVFCILTHGHGSSREGGRKYSVLFKELGISTIIYDLRNHGLNLQNSPVLMGYQESKDLNEVINQVYDKFGKDIILGLQGVSMGASTSIMVLKYNQKLKFVIEDCGYATLKNVVDDILKRFHLANWLFLPLVDFDLKLFYHLSFEKVRPIDSLKNNSVPILFIHGKKDNFVRVNNCYEFYKEGTFARDIEIFPDANHAACISNNRDLYKEKISEFLKNIKVL
jgi:fermentation-respiration switch protein FrsA (DUF1100 family)